MGKNFCTVENKWCKFLKRGVCKYSNCTLDNIDKCKRVTEIETTTFSELLGQVNFDDVFKELTRWFNDQEKNESGYRNVFFTLLDKTPRRHKLDDLFINIEKVKEEDSTWLDVSGVHVAKKDKVTYGIEFEPWDEWISMYVTQHTLDTLTKEEIVAACLYEMTFFGFTDSKVQSERDRLIESVEEAKAKRNG